MVKRSKSKQVAGSEVSPRITTASVGIQRPPSWSRRDWLWGLILILLVIVAYTPVWRAGFVWDDDAILTANPCIVGPLGLKEIWTTSAADICPLTLTTFWIEHALCGLGPLPYHLVNVLLHAACAVSLWQVLRSLRVRGAWLGAAVWALHPVAVESVAWITEMKNTESGLFFLLSILFFVRWLRAKELDRITGGRWNYALTLLFAALAMASKSSTVILPVVLFLCAWWVGGRSQWRNVVRVLPIFLMAIAASALSIWTQGSQLATVTDPRWVRTWPQRLAIAGDAVWFYLSKLLWPHPLMTIYPRWQIDATQWASYLPLLAVIGISSVFWLKRERWSRACFFAFAYFMAALLPVLGLIDNYIFQFSLIFDHLQYLASIGPLALAGTGLVRCADFIIPKKPMLQSSLCAGLLLILGTATWQRTWAYESQEALWTDAVSKNPDCWVGHYDLGFVFLQKGQVDEAIRRFQKALEINPNFKEAHSNLGVALGQKGQVDEAVAQFQKALELGPEYARGHYNFGYTLLQKGQLDEAVAQFQKALEINPNYVEAHTNLGLALLQKGQVDDAVAQFQKAAEIDPNSFMTHYNFGVALVKKRQLNDAVGQYQRALEINPKSLEAHYNLGLALFQKRQPDEAITQFREVLRLKPDFSPARDNLAKAQALVRQGEGHQ
ncbi:MAG: tetratricopeptide repeat protein [Verrucomicrobia bacterium]|nr:tetratricopeptide repeat protein [Verrucomicrobiota bacterium]